MRDPDTGPDRRAVLRAVGGGLGLSIGLEELLPGGLPGDAGAGGGGVADPGASMAAARTRFHEQRAVTGKLECTRMDQREIYGPTDVNAQTGNGRLSVGLNDAGTLTVFRWPYPSHYDQLKYYTLGRDGADRIQVLDNEGAFLGLLVDGETSWLRDWTATQRYRDDPPDPGTPFSDEVVTTYTPPDGAGPFGAGGGPTVEVRDLVARDADALVRRVRVVWPSGPPAGTTPRLVAYENVNPVVSKLPQVPIQDWCTEEANRDRARYLAGPDAIVHDLAGVDVSTGDPQSVAVAMGFGGESVAHQVGGDAHEPVATPAGLAGPTRDAYDAASAGAFPGNDLFVGQTTGALATDLAFVGQGQGEGEGAVATETVLFAAGHTPEAATATLADRRDRPFEAVRTGKEAWLDDLLSAAPMPDTDDDALLALCRRALVTLVTDAEATDDRAIVASIATQAPYGEDWIRDGAYFNRALEVVGLGAGGRDWVADRNRWYADVQQRLDDPRPSHPTTPPGNWAMNYYGDGVAGGPIPYEIDETGYGIWTLWRHYAWIADEDRAAGYLADVYPAIRRAAEFLVRCRDVETDLHCPTWEDDRFQPQRPTIVGASLVWLGLRSAARAARHPASPGTAAAADRYEARQHEVGRAIDRHLFGDVAGDGTGTGAYGVRIGFPMAEVVWPVGFTPYADPDTGTIRPEPTVEDPFDHPRIQSHLDAVWHSISPAFDAPGGDAPSTGQYEAKGLIPLAMAGRTGTDEPGSLADVRAGLDWIVSRHASADTRVMGEAWQVFGGPDGEPEVRSIVSQPHAWEQVLVYLAALETYGHSGAGGGSA